MPRLYMVNYCCVKKVKLNERTISIWRAAWPKMLVKCYVESKLCSKLKTCRLNECLLNLDRGISATIITHSYIVDHDSKKIETVAFAVVLPLVFICIYITNNRVLLSPFAAV